MQVALIEFTEVGKKYHFSLNGNEYKQNDYVIVDTIKGLEMGRIYMIKDVNDKDIQTALKPIIRLANQNDFDMKEHNQQLEEIVTKEVIKMVNELKLEMKVLESEYTLDRKKLTIYFEAEKRVDFRELVRRISEVYHTRIELRQIGPRDVAKLIGGIGPCGLTLCCTTFLGEFDTVSIKMAKNQHIALNPQKISGVCGKLLCCIKYEDDIYTELKELMPDIGEIVNYNEFDAKVISLDILKQMVRISYFEEGESKTVWTTLEEIKPI